MTAQIHEPGEGIRTIQIGDSVMIAKADATTTDARSSLLRAR